MAKEASGANAENLLLATFHVGDGFYGLDASRVQEVIRVRRVTRVPDAAGCIRGLINLRGKIATLIDLGKKLGVGSDSGGERRALIVEQNGELLGLLVDRVSDVVEVAPDNLLPPPAAAGANSAFYAGVCRSGGRLITLLNVGRILETGNGR